MKSRIFSSALSFALIVGLGACGGNTKPTLGQLKYEQDDEEVIEYEKLSRQEVIEEYQDLLDVFEDDKLKENIQRRIADVYLLEGDQKQYENSDSTSLYVDAIKAYRNILERYPNSPDNAEVLYQLAKAYDLEGQPKDAKEMLIELTTRHPNYPNNAEAYFRLGDIYFGEKNYVLAARSYTAVANSSNQKLKLNAWYMRGWSQYKLSQFNSAANSFSFVLERLLTTNTDLVSLGKRDSAVAQDALHSLSLTLDKLGGINSITSIGGLSQQRFVWLVYKNLGDFYREKELYQRAAESYRAFSLANPLDPRGPEFHGNIIQTYIDGDFPKQALREKYEFINQFGIHSAFYNQVGVDAKTLGNIKVYLDELARYNYAEGLKKREEIDELEKQGKANEQELVDLAKAKDKHFSEASSFYGQYLETFPNDARYDDIVFLQAEARFVIGQYKLAAQGYEHVAYTPKGSSAVKHAADAGYSAILAYQKHIESFPVAAEERKLWQEKAVGSMLRFSEKYHSDSRSASVLTNAAEYLFGLNRYQQAIDVGQHLLQSNNSLDDGLTKTALGIVAHSYFSLADYKNAQINYLRQREYVTEGGEEYKTISERLASTTFKLSEAHLAAEENEDAIKELLNIKKWTPDSPVRVNAQYDAATLMMEAGNWLGAITELKELNALYAEHELAPEFPKKLAYSYRSNENWLEAAEVYLSLHQSHVDPEVRREALFSAAQMYEQNLSYDTAITYFKSYAYTYEQPFETRMEARYKLALNYERLDEAKKSRYWLRRLIDGDAKAGANRTERSRWLASWAQSKYGDYYAGEFRKQRLRLPLAKSIAKKKQAMSMATKRYQASADAGFLEFVTQSSYKIAGLYSELSDSVQRSPRPKGLNAEDLNTYESVLTEQSESLNQVAIDLHLANIERAWGGKFNEWIQKSFIALKALNPERFAKEEVLKSYGNEIR